MTFAPLFHPHFSVRWSSAIPPVLTANTHNSYRCWENENLLKSSALQDAPNVIYSLILVTFISRERLALLSWNFGILPNLVGSTYCKNISQISDIDCATLVVTYVQCLLAIWGQLLITVLMSYRWKYSIVCSWYNTMSTELGIIVSWVFLSSTSFIDFIKYFESVLWISLYRKMIKSWLFSQNMRREKLFKNYKKKSLLTCSDICLYIRNKKQNTCSSYLT
jgi:hypothetical protein